jgi:glycosyl transferase, family 25
MDFSFFVISLKRTPDRLQGFSANNAGTGIDFEHFEAIDGMSMDSSARTALVSSHATGYTPGALGVAASHRALWLRCSEQQNPFVICEDDAVLRDDIADQLPRLISRADDWDIVMLGFNFDVGLETEIVPGILMGGGFSVKYPTQQHLHAFASGRGQVALQRLNLCFGICAYAISPTGARRLLQKAFPMDNRPTVIKSANRSFPAYGVDCMMATLYPQLTAYVCIAPLAMTPNSQHSSLTQR